MSAIYLVNTPNGEHLIDATNQQVAINHVIRGTHTAKALTAKQLSEKLDAGLKVVVASTPKPTEPAKE